MKGTPTTHAPVASDARSRRLGSLPALLAADSDGDGLDDAEDNCPR